MKSCNRHLAPMLFLALFLCQPASATTDEDEAMFEVCPELKAWAASHPHGGDEASQVAAAAEDKATMPELRAELKRRVAADQAVRERASASAGPPDEKSMQEWFAVDRANLEWLKKTIAATGFPTVEQVGEAGVRDAFVLVQHADADPLLQQAVLETLRPRLATAGIRKSEFAMLTDRVLTGQGKPQRFGTQFKREKDGSFALQPTEDMSHLDERRQQMELMPLPLYECVLRASYATP